MTVATKRNQSPVVSGGNRGNTQASAGELANLQITACRAIFAIESAAAQVAGNRTLPDEVRRRFHRLWQFSASVKQEILSLVQSNSEPNMIGRPTHWAVAMRFFAAELEGETRHSEIRKSAEIFARGCLWLERCFLEPDGAACDNGIAAFEDVLILIADPDVSKRFAA